MLFSKQKKFVYVSVRCRKVVYSICKTT